ncbi:MAG: hypothetical protein IJ733_08040 [Lachnospiraceae bacterium]|nr:hypothetical protein [Lachnospiraceae bacterium]
MEMVKETYFQGKQYFTIVEQDAIYVVSECKEIFCLKMETERITGAVFYDDGIYYSLEGESNIYYRRKNGEEKKFCFDYPKVVVCCQVKNRGNRLVFALDVGECSFCEVILFDWEKKEEICPSPFSKELCDIAFVNENQAVEIVEERKNVSVYADDLDYMTYLVAGFDLSDRDGENIPKVFGSQGVFEEMVFEGLRESCVEEGGMRWCFFDYYFYYYPNNYAICTSGQHILYSCKDVGKGGLIIGNSLDGRAYRLFELPFEEMGACEEDFFFYDDGQDMVTYIKCDGRKMMQFQIVQEESCLEELNRIYDEAYKNRMNIRKHPETEGKFQKLLYQALFSAEVKETGRWSL